MAISDKLVHGDKLTKEAFLNPPVDMGILPFWFWNGQMDESEMLWQMKEYKSKGIPGLFIHGRFGEKIGYLSDKWMERVSFAVEKAKDLGLQIWIYDEMNWPSGTAERTVIKKYPHLSQKYLELVALNVDGPLFTFLEATDSRYVNTGDSRPICAYAVSDEEYKSGVRKMIDLTPNLSFNKVIPWEAPEGRWRLLYFLEKEVPYYIDALNPESTERFIEMTHERYKSHIGDDFQSVVPGFYTDEPAMHYFQVGVDNFVIPWSKEMFKIFRTRRGYDLRPYLPALYMNMGSITSKVRYDFWRTLSEQYSEVYYKRLHDWCEDNHIIFTGHVLFEEWLRLQARCEGNIFHHLRHMHMTGVDHLYPKIGTEKEPDQHVALKLASSASHQFGSERLLCESMGGAYWDCTLERMRWIANWEYVLGVNLFNNHGYHYSIEGERKRDWPPSQFYHHTWWKYYEQFTTYMSRLGLSLSGGRHVARVLMLYPLNSIWTNYTPQKRSDVAKIIEDEFYFLTDTLLRLHYDYDYVDEDILTELGSIKGDKIRLKDEEYELMILPPVTHIKRQTFEFIRKFVEKGGKLLTCSLLPIELLEDKTVLEGNPFSRDLNADGKSSADGKEKLNISKELNGSRELSGSRELKEFFGIDTQSLLKSFQSPSRQNGKLRLKKNKGLSIEYISQKGKKKSERKEELRNTLRKMITPDVEISHEDVFYLHRLKDQYHIYFIVNTSKDDLGEVDLSFDLKGLRPEIWDALTGKIERINVFEEKNGRTHLKLKFSPSEAHLVVFKDRISPKDDLILDSNLSIESFEGSIVKGYIDNISSSEDPFVKLLTQGKLKTIRQKKQKSLRPIKLGKRFKFTIEDDNALLLSRWKMKMLDEADLTNEDSYAAEGYDDSKWLSVTQGAWEMQLPFEREHETYPQRLLYRTYFTMDFIPEDGSDVKLLIDGFSGSNYSIHINGSRVELSQAKRSSLDAEIKQLSIKEYLKSGLNVVMVSLTAERRTDGILDLLKIMGQFSLEPLSQSEVMTNGADYKIVPLKSELRVGDWTKEGYPYFSGTATYQTEVEIAEEYLSGKIFLSAEVGEDVLEARVNDSPSKVIPWHPYKIDLTEELRPGVNKITLKVTNTLINILEAVKKPSGIMKEPLLTYYPLYQFDLNSTKTSPKTGPKAKTDGKAKTNGKAKKSSQKKRQAV